MRGPIGRHKSAKFSSLSGHLLREIIAPSGSYGETGPNTGPVAYLRRPLSPGSDGNETPLLELLACVAISGPEEVCKFRRYQTPTPRDNRDFRLLLWGNGANTGQLAYLRRHFHRKRWH
ncbi:hypothetical protein DPMN_092406 [Dreissena polymorpha]|uniref:Uncharacterized protein n=1 Tax=Dreissena polymorpha TaxID=45954 RepID=A0A9D4L3V3_DREPO|nr:hypothetical protein DPMN_092406 [Dreissena polymorpha]